MIKPTKWHVRPAKTQISLGIAQSDQSLPCPHEEPLGPWLSFERTVKTLIRLGGCPDWSGCSLGTQDILLVLSCCGTSICLKRRRKFESANADCFWYKSEVTGLRIFQHWKFLSITVNQENGSLNFKYEPRHEKTCFCHMRITKAQISLRIRAVWSAPLLFAAWIV